MFGTRNATHMVGCNSAEYDPVFDDRKTLRRLFDNLAGTFAARINKIWEIAENANAKVRSRMARDLRQRAFARLAVSLKKQIVPSFNAANDNLPASSGPANLPPA
jgi:hypothetical protein